MNKVLLWFATLSVWHRMAILVAALLIPIAFLATFVIKVELEKVAALQDEVKGLDLIAPMAHLTRVVAEHRDQTVMAASGDARKRRALSKTTARVGQVILEIDKNNKNSGDKLGLSERWGAVKQAWIALSEATPSLSAQDVNDRHNVLIGELNALRLHVAEASKLLFDENPGNYFMVVASTVELPTVTQALSDLRAEAVNIAIQGGEISGEAKQRLVARQELVKSTLGRVRYNLTKAVEFDPSLAAVADERFASERNASAYFQKIDDTFLKPEKVEQSAERSFKDGLQVVSRLEEYGEQVHAAIRDRLEQNYSQVQSYVIKLLVLLGIGLAFAISIAVMIAHGIAGPLSHLSDVAKRVAAGEKSLRAQISTYDEIGSFARQFDLLLDRQVEAKEKTDADNQGLNTSVLRLLEAVAKIAERNLTIKVPVSEDVTGSVSDAINLMTEETSKVLGQVVAVAQGVAGASTEVRQQADSAMNVALDDKIKVEQAAGELQQAAETMTEISRLALASNESAAKAFSTTEQAQETVLGTVAGIAGIRDTIRETEKRIKRLGERSQEIGGVVSLINHIAERTHILALNASMHAASAGEAGRGFAVVANEVQRLAESAREATGQIAGLVNSIQAETADAVNTMNDTISRVVEGTQLAERAGVEMGNTREVTSELVEYVKRIGESSKQQVNVARRLVERATELQASAQLTYDSMQNQAASTVALADYSDRLIESVSVFTLPESARISVDDVNSTSFRASGRVKRVA
jgi:twitching motility protein PilJ